MSKYKVGDKVVLTVTSTNEMGCLPCYVLNDDLILSKQDIDKYAEPLSNYTEPLSNKVADQRKEINHLLRKIKEKEAAIERLEDELRSRAQKLTWQKGVEAGQKEAWELAKKIVIQNGYSSHDLYEIFESNDLQLVLEEYTYQEAAAKVAEWEKAKDEIKAGDIVESNNGNGERIAVIDVWPSADGLHFEGISSNKTLTIDASAKYYTKTGRHIDIGSFLKQIGGGDDEK